MRRLVLVVPLMLALPGCFIYFGDDDCGSGGGGAPLPEERNPETGQCEALPWGGGCDGDPIPATDVGGGAAPVAPGEADIAIARDWASCEGPCEGLDETSCLAADGCRAAYVDTCPLCEGPVPQLEYVGCWGTAPSGPVRGGGCGGLDAYECSRHDDCSPVHARLEVPVDGGGFMSVIGNFEFCWDEPGNVPGCYSDQDCPTGTVCTADTECLPPPGCDPSVGACPAVCYGRCVAAPPPTCDQLDEPTCVARGDCAPLYAGSDCSCDANGCSCSSWDFRQCVAGDGGGGGAWSCGNEVCGADQVCQVSYPGIPGGSITYACIDLPPLCSMGGNPLGTCDCLQQAGVCAMNCSTDDAGHTKAECYLP